MSVSTEERVAVLETRVESEAARHDRLENQVMALMKSLERHERDTLELIRHFQEQTAELQRAQDRLTGVLKGLVYVSTFVGGVISVVSKFWGSFKGIFS